jgi:hypothetical protein
LEEGEGGAAGSSSSTTTTTTSTLHGCAAAALARALAHEAVATSSVGSVALRCRLFSALGALACKLPTALLLAPVQQEPAGGAEEAQQLQQLQQLLPPALTPSAPSTLGATLLSLLWGAVQSEERFSLAKAASLQALSVCVQCLGEAGSAGSAGVFGGAARAVGSEVAVWASRASASDPRVSEAALRVMRDLAAL